MTLNYGGFSPQHSAKGGEIKLPVATSAITTLICKSKPGLFLNHSLFLTNYFSDLLKNETLSKFNLFAKGHDFVMIIKTTLCRYLPSNVV